MNHLRGQTSPYLLQHLYNPVDWYPWGEEALAKARAEDKPLFVSIGYAACHWCHVMERESFEDESVAALLNEHFVSVKVDREERPDLDDIYMSAVQVLTGQGGWPLNVFLTPDLEPFVGGTYFPPENRYGRIGFPEMLARVEELWRTRREDVHRAARDLTEGIRRIGAGPVGGESDGVPGREEITRAAAELADRFDGRWGGFGGAPKFPPDTALALLLREHGRSGEPMPLRMVETTLDRMALGGMYDHIGGGFARYSVDDHWLVPHFEKMLYNQALTVPNYVDAWRLTRHALYRRVVFETLDFVRRELTSADGGFFSSLDADSEGEEGRFYVWSPAEIRETLGPADAELFGETYDVTAAGNFEGRSIPNLIAASLAERAARGGEDETALDARLAPLRAKLLVARETRVRPGTDDKILTAWNGLMISAFARAHEAFERPEDLESARRAASFTLDKLRSGGRLLVSHREGCSRLNAYLDDYAFFARALLDLYEAGFDGAHLDASAELARTALDHFEDGEHGGFFFTSDDHETLLTRSRSQHDGALPAGAGVMAELLLRLAVHFDDDRFRQSAERALRALAPGVHRSPSAYASLLLAADTRGGPIAEIVIGGDPGREDTRALLRVVRERYLPRRVLALVRPGEARDARPLLAGKTVADGAATAWVCRDYACREPTSDPERLRELLAE